VKSLVVESVLEEVPSAEQAAKAISDGVLKQINTAHDVD
jgi:hypothetical protein